MREQFRSFQGRFRVDIRTPKQRGEARHWNGLPRAAMGSPTPEMCKKWADVALRNRSAMGLGGSGGTW